MKITPEQEMELAKFPVALQTFIDSELASGNSIVEIGHSFPAPPAGSYIMLASKVSTRARDDGDGLSFYDRNNSSYSGEFTDAKRFYFVLEPPNPPPAELYRDALRKSLEPKTNLPEADSRTNSSQLCEETLNAEKHLDSVAAIQKEIIAAIKDGARYYDSHKEGGTKICWERDRFVRSDYGDDPDERHFTDESEFLKMLYNFCHWQATCHSDKDQLSEIDTWRLILRRMALPKSVDR